MIPGILLLIVSLSAATPPHSTAAIQRPWLGCALTVRNGGQPNAFLWVAEVPEGTPAYKAGLRRADIVSSIDGKPVAFSDNLDVLEFVSKLKPGDIVIFKVYREGASRSCRIVVGELPPEFQQRFDESVKRARSLRQSKKKP